MSGLRTSKHYDLKFKLQVIDEVISGRMSKEEASRTFGIKGHCTIAKWIHRFVGNSVSMQHSNNESNLKRIKELEQLLEHERLKRIAAEQMINIAEQELKISIRKKSDTKQLKN